MTVKKLWQKHHARHIGTVLSHAMHAEDKDRCILKFFSQRADKPVDSPIDLVNALGSCP
jgi:hypothetical protein